MDDSPPLFLPNINEVIMSGNAYEPNTDDIEIEEEKIDSIIEKA